MHTKKRNNNIVFKLSLEIASMSYKNIFSQNIYLQTKLQIGYFSRDKVFHDNPSVLEDGIQMFILIVSQIDYALNENKKVNLCEIIFNKIC